jgi:4-hydroxy-3-methylbut-2-enyl diphosphate reductase IspH
VAKIHREVSRYRRHGYEVVLIGRAGHDEVVGLPAGGTSRSGALGKGSSRLPLSVEVTAAAAVRSAPGH